MTKQEIKNTIKTFIKNNLMKIKLYEDLPPLNNNFTLCWRNESEKYYNLFYQTKEQNTKGLYNCIDIYILKDKKNTIDIFLI